MEFQARAPREGINVSESHPLREAATLIVGLALVLAGLLVVVTWSVDLAIYFISPQTEARAFASLDLDPLVEQIGEDNLLFETDFPHPTCFYIPTPDVQNHRVDVTSARSESTRRKILQDNAAALYNIDLPSSQ